MRQPGFLRADGKREPSATASAPVSMDSILSSLKSVPASQRLEMVETIVPQSNPLSPRATSSEPPSLKADLVEVILPEPPKPTPVFPLAPAPLVMAHGAPDSTTVIATAEAGSGKSKMLWYGIGALILVSGVVLYLKSK